jgi:threonine aldolase
MTLMIDLTSDTKTKPSEAMREAIMRAEVGDEQYGEDPTVNALCARVSALTGKEAALFLPSGTMCNEIALNVHCRPGDEVVCERSAHILTAEAGGPAALSGVMVQPIDGERGQFTADQLSAAIRPPSRYLPVSRLVVVEQTSNLGGGSVWPLAKIESVVQVARARGLSLHMDGARLMNAAVASSIPVRAYAQSFDTVWVDFSKGLGAPFGAVLCGDAPFIDAAWRVKQRIGGAMRQAGLMAAAALYALEHNVARLAEDHANARRLAEGLAAIPGIHVDPTNVETNIVFFDLAGSAPDAADFVANLRKHGIAMGAFGSRRIRAVTHLDVCENDIERTLVTVAELLQER